MRREDFTLDVHDVDWVEDGGEPREPTVVIDFEGDQPAFEQRLTGRDGEKLDASETDVAFRFVDAGDEGGDAGVVSVTDRITGDFILELNEDAEDVLKFIRAARRYGEHADSHGSYHVRVLNEGETVVEYQKETFLVYSEDGDLLRDQSLIPGGVEI
jgi:hypothetical protein